MNEGNGYLSSLSRPKTCSVEVCSNVMRVDINPNLELYVFKILIWLGRYHALKAYVAMYDDKS